MAHARRRRRLRSRWAGGGGSLPPLASPRAPPWPRAAVPARASVEDATPAEAPPCRTVVPLDHVHRPSTANASAVSTGPPPHGLRSASRRTAVQNGQSIKQYFTANGENEAEQVSNIQLMDAEVALYWKIMCKHLQAEARFPLFGLQAQCHTLLQFCMPKRGSNNKHLQAEAQVKGSEAATTTGAEAAVYASEASDKNDLLDNVLPSTITDYVDL